MPTEFTLGLAGRERSINGTCFWVRCERTELLTHLCFPGTGPAPSRTSQTIVECQVRDRKLPDKQAFPYLSSRWAGRLSWFTVYNKCNSISSRPCWPSTHTPGVGCFC